MRFKERVAAIGYKITDEMEEKFNRYRDLLNDWNQRMDLTNVSEPDEIEDRHFIDSFSLLRKHPHFEGRWIDVGTGAGFPGLPIAILFPNVEMTLLDSLNKRITFLDAVVEELELSNVTTIHARAEDAFRAGALRESFDGAVSRAVAPLPTLLEYTLPAIKVGGVFLAMKGPAAEEELNVSEKALRVLGGEIETIDRFQWTEQNAERVNICVRKIARTPEKYPRSGAKPRKNPL